MMKNVYFTGKIVKWEEIFVIIAYCLKTVEIEVFKIKALPFLTSLREIRHQAVLIT